MSVRETVEQIAHNPKVAGLVGTATTGTGMGTIFDIIPDDIGKLATVVGIILSCILIRTHWTNMKKANLELEMLREEKKKRSE